MKTETKRWLGRIVAGLFLLISFVAFWSAKWYISVYGKVGFDAILFTMTGSLKGVEPELIFGYLRKALLPSVLCTVVVWCLLYLPRDIRVRRKEGEPVTVLPIPVPTVVRRIIAIVLCVVLLLSGAAMAEMPQWILGKIQVGSLYETEYQDPKQTQITFPEEKRNLIYIFMESMETTFMAPEQGGGQPYDSIPELYQLAQENINFSQNEGVGGWSRTTGATWTVGGMVSQTAGIPLAGGVDGNSYGELSEFLPGITNLQDILHDQGYYQALMVGSDVSFGGRDKYFAQHGTDRIYDIYTAREDGVVAPDYAVWWGMEDLHLYEYAKRELTEIAQRDQPFAFTMLTVDTHHVGGYYCDLCQDEFPEYYSDVAHCASRQVTDFLEWLKQQEFYENTTVVICGDHQSMDGDFFARNMDPDYDRCVYNCIVNSPITTARNKFRLITPFDMFPTTLAAMGCEIEGDRLGLGVNLFSIQPTLAERLGGYKKMNEELSKRSDYYDQVFLDIDRVSQATSSEETASTSIEN